MKTDECRKDAAINPERLTHEVATITDDDLDYIWQKQELLLNRRILASDGICQSSDLGEPPGLTRR